MIDSVFIKIPYNQVIEVNHYKNREFKVHNGRERVSGFAHTRTAQHKKEGWYKPDIRLERQIRKGLENFIVVQASLPKLLHGCSLYEIQEGDMKLIVQKLQEHLRQAGHQVSDDAILGARVCRIDFAKIIELPESLKAKTAIEQLHKAGYSPRSDLTQRDVRDGKEGFWIKFYNSTHSVTIYDKVKEIEKQGYTLTERALKRQIKAGTLKPHFIKFEVALQKTQKVHWVLNKILGKHQKQYSLQEVFKKDIAQKVLLHFLNESFNAQVDFLCQNFHEKDLRSHIRNIYGYKRQKVALFFILEEIKARGSQIVLKEIQTLHGYSARQRTEKDLKELSKALEAIGSGVQPLKIIKEQLISFKPYLPKQEPKPVKHQANLTLFDLGVTC